MYDLVSGISCYVEKYHSYQNKLMLCIFKEIRNTLDTVMKGRTTEGVMESPERVSLKKNSPEKLRKTVLAGWRVGLRGIKEQVDLRRYPDFQINNIKVDGNDVLIYR